LVTHHCKKCGHSAGLVWHDRCPGCNIGTAMARCSNCQYYGHYKEFWGKGCPKCSSAAILASESKTFEEKLPWIIAASATIIVFLLLFIGIIIIEKSLFDSTQLSDDLANLFYSWYFWLSVAIGLLLGAFMGFRFEARRKRKQKVREVLARNKKRDSFDATMQFIGAKRTHSLQASTEPNAQTEKMLKNITEDKNMNEQISAVTPIGKLHSKRIRKVKTEIKELLNRLPIIEYESISECRQKMTNRSGAIHPSMYSGSLEKVVEFVLRMIQETEKYILASKGIINLEKVLLISDWPLGIPVLEIQYEQFWDNGTFNIYSEHVMRTDSDLYEVFGSTKSNDRMKLVLKNGT
jgi:hypothetical protein